MPYVTYALIFINIFVHLANLSKSQADFDAVQMRWGMVIGDPSVVGLFTHLFLHANWQHLFSNMLVLWIIGTVLECGIGSLLFSLLYLASGIAAVFLHGIIVRLFDPASVMVPMIGASGAIAGITGFAAFRYYHLRVLNFIIIPNFLVFIPGLQGMANWLPVIPIPVPLWLPFWVYVAYFGGKELLFGLFAHDSVAHWAHLGGMTLGFLAAIMLRSFQDGKRESALEESAKVADGETPTFHSVEELQRLLRLHPDDPELLEAMAGIAMLNGEIAGSHTLYLQAIPQFLKHGNVNRAAITYLNILKIDPETTFLPRQQLSLASALESLGHYPEAARAFALLAEAHPQSDEAQSALLRAAQIQFKQLQAAPVAATLLTTLLQQYPDSPWHNLAGDRLREVQHQLYHQ